jgi:hypothetical protein
LVLSFYGAAASEAVSSFKMNLSSLNGVPRTAFERMVCRARVLALIDRRRLETGDSEVGQSIERLIVAMSLAEIVVATAHEAAPRDEFADSAVDAVE